MSEPITNYTKLVNRQEFIRHQLGQYQKVAHELGGGEDACLAGGHGSLAKNAPLLIVPAELRGRFDDLLQQCRQHYLDELNETNKRIDAVDTLLAGFDAKKGGAA